MSTEQDFEDFAKKYPDVMAKSQQEYIGVSKGWHHILDALFSKWTQPLDSARSTLKYALENPDQKYTKSIPELEAEVQKQLDRIPVILQIKEKFGGLRIYTNGVDTEYDNYVEFAESMSYRCCEVCGAPGKPRNTGWTKTLCDTHAEKAEAGENVFDDDDED